MGIQLNREFGRIANGVKIQVLEAGLACLGREWRKEEVCSPFSRLYYVLSGKGAIRLHSPEEGSRVHILEPGYAYLIPRGLSYDYFCDERLEKIYFHMNVTLGNGLDIFHGCSHYYVLPERKEMLMGMGRWIVSNRPEDALHLQGEIYHAVALFIEKAAVEGKLCRNYSELVTRLFALSDTWKNSVPIKDLAKELHVSESTLTKRFRREMGMSVGEYREMLLMEKARQLLALGKMSVGEIAEELGYCDQFYFARYFRQRQGLSPSAYKKRYTGGNW